MAHAPRDRGAALGDHAPHLFLSHSSKDDRWVAQLAEDLNLCGVDVWLDTWELRVGDDLHERISDAIQKSRFVGVVVTRHFSESKWTKGEVHQALSREKAEDRTVVLPLLADGGTLPAVLSGKKSLDFEADYFPSLVRLAGLIHNLETDTIEKGLTCGVCADVHRCMRVLQWAGWTPLHVVGARTLSEILRAGGWREGDVVQFDPVTIIDADGISPSLRQMMEKMLPREDD